MGASKDKHSTLGLEYQEGCGRSVWIRQQVHSKQIVLPFDQDRSHSKLNVNLVRSTTLDLNLFKSMSDGACSSDLPHSLHINILSNFVPH